MSQSTLTRESVYGLRISVAGSEEWVTFRTIEQMARALVRRSGGGPAYRSGRRYAASHRDPVHQVSDDGTCLRVVTTQTFQVAHSHWGTTVQTREDWTTFEVHGPSGRLLNVLGVMALGEARELAEHRSLYWRGRNDYCGWGPVPGIRKYRGGGGRYHRRFSTMNERRAGDLVIAEEGEIAPRASRRGTNLPNPWDDYCRIKERNWKSQTKGRKSWDRARKQRKGESA